MKLRSLVLLAFLTVAGASAAPVYYSAVLGNFENPPTGSPGTGFVLVSLDTILHQLTIEVTFSGLTGNTTAAHIHCCVVAPGNASVVVQPGTLSGFPLGVTSGVYSILLDTTQASTYTAAFVTANGGTTAGAEAALAAGLSAGQSYFNVHTTLFPGGEIRGFLVATPEPGTYALLGLGLAGLAFLRHKVKI